MYSNVYKQSVVEADARLGVYSGCDPQPNGSFVCHSYSHNDYNCWWNQTCHDDEGLHTPRCYSGTFDKLCDKKQCKCAALTERSLGKMQCPMCNRNASWHKQTPFWKRLEGVSNMLNGSWFSTRTEGKCAPGQRPGGGSSSTTRSSSSSGIALGQHPEELGSAHFNQKKKTTSHDGQRCFWREVSSISVNATCVRNALVTSIQKRQPKCWQGCPQPTNITSGCWVTCMLEVINGNPSKDLRPMDSKELIAPFEAAFASDDPHRGGCPRVRV